MLQDILIMHTYVSLYSCKNRKCNYSILLNEDDSRPKQNNSIKEYIGLDNAMKLFL